MDSPTELPPLDVHAHIAPDVTEAQVRRLGPAVVFAVTRSLAEASAVPHGCHPRMLWGLGVHPGDDAAQASYDPTRFERMLPRFSLVGEIGLDRRAGNLDRQRVVIDDILGRVAGAPVMLSLHSSGMAEEIVTLLEQHHPLGPILHWFTGTVRDVARAAAAGAWFSVNARAQDELLKAMPRDRVLTETDFPFTRKQGSARPGAAEPVEVKLATAWECTPADARRQVWSNLASLVRVCGSPSLPDGVSAPFHLL